MLPQRCPFVVVVEQPALLQERDDAVYQQVKPILIHVR